MRQVAGRQPKGQSHPTLPHAHAHCAARKQAAMRHYMAVNITWPGTLHGWEDHSLDSLKKKGQSDTGNDSASKTQLQGLGIDDVPDPGSA